MIKNIFASISAAVTAKKRASYYYGLQRKGLFDTCEVGVKLKEMFDESLSKSNVVAAYAAAVSPHDNKREISYIQGVRLDNSDVYIQLNDEEPAFVSNIKTDSIHKFCETVAKDVGVFITSYSTISK